MDAYIYIYIYIVLVDDVTAGRTKDRKYFVTWVSITGLREKADVYMTKKGVFLSPVLHFGRFISITTTPLDVIKLSPHSHRSLFLY